MCKTPNLLADGQLVACRKCWQCLEHRVDDWVGRCIAESKFSAASSSITLTYGKDHEGRVSHPRAAVLTYSDVQKYFKYLRADGHECRYFAVGEYGSKKGRAHWHILVFWKTKIPSDVQWNTRFMQKHWPHGFSHWVPIRKGFTKGSIRYACKYVNKDIGDVEAQAKYCMSKKPPLGADYFEYRAQKYVDAGLSPQDLFYEFPEEGRRKDGSVIRFQLQGKSADLFCQHYIDKWKAQRGGHYPPSVMLDEYEDRMTRSDWDRDGTFAPSLQTRARQNLSFLPPNGFGQDDVKFDVKQGAWYVESDGHRLWWTVNEQGQRAWRSEVIEAVTSMMEDRSIRIHQPEGLQPNSEFLEPWLQGADRFPAQADWTD